LQYLHERKVTKFDELVSLLVTDRIKSSLTDQFHGYKPQHQGQGQGKTTLDVDALFVSHYKSECDKFKEKGKWPPKHVSSATVKSHGQGNTGADNKAQRTRPR